ncbi:MAG: M15 family metallopeptidase [Saprospiraceae bacterium]
MSATLTKEYIIFMQRLLKSNGLYTGRIDGSWGPKTTSAVETFEALSLKLAKDLGSFDEQTERNIKSLHLKAQEAARKFMKTLKTAGITARIISGTRTYEEQNTLYKKGRNGNHSPKVTNAKGGQSNHNFGIAWDIGIFINDKYMTSVSPYNEAGQVALAASIPKLEWGGNWVKFVDRPHYQLDTQLALAEERDMFEKGQPYI